MRGWRENEVLPLAGLLSAPEETMAQTISEGT